MKITKSFKRTGCVVSMVSMMILSFGLHAAIPGLELSTVDLHAKKATMVTPDGDSIEIWGFAPGNATQPTGPVQYPGPTLIVDEGDTVIITLHNDDLPQATSLVFPGQSGVTGSGTVAAGGASITYSFVASNPGTYLYHSGESPQVQIDMGLAGALIVRPAAGDNFAYNDPASAFDKEYLMFLSEMDPKLHYLAQDDAAALAQWDNAGYVSQLFFINGRNAPDTLAPDGAPELPHQPYGSLMTMYPREKVLVRVLSVGRNQHPLHLHGNHFDQIARDGIPMAAKVTDYTLNAIPGSTADLIWDWTGIKLGWDIFNPADGHTCNGPADGFDPVSGEYCGDHGKPLPVIIPENQDLAFGGFYSGSPYIGQDGTLPIGEGGLNPTGGLAFMWHSHSERELTNNDIFPGGMFTMAIVERRP